ncbi:hypothetical protein EDB80DRAFT_673859 [Ilyonectria destructans]|nr:hypothetical protein EDB80DRAFT_673859 [Ilyonectria destructans]
MATTPALGAVGSQSGDVITFPSPSLPAISQELPLKQEIYTTPRTRLSASPARPPSTESPTPFERSTSSVTRFLTPSTNPYHFCATHPQGIIAHRQRPCGWVEYGDTKVECRNCADIRPNQRASGLAQT